MAEIMDNNKLAELLSYGRDVAQGASNAIASNISAPVDGLAWLLKKAGIPVNDPVGGSDWMAGKGLTREPANQLAGLLGETAGMVGPGLLAAKAPQVARGLLNMAENAMAPRTLNSQAGAIVWHGSPHKFDAFDAGKIGTGEGAQAYGHGLYLAESPEVAQMYKDKLTDPAFKYASQNQAKARIKEKIATRVEATDPARAALLRAEVASLSDQSGALYKVDLPDEHIAKMLDWDKPLSQQAPETIAALRNGYKQSFGVSDRYLDDMLQPHSTVGTAIGAGRMSKVMTENLRAQGIPGIRYLDGGSRGNGVGTSNYVVFPGNEGLLSILERNGAPIK